MDLSVVIPVYNESSKIGNDIVAASDFMQAHGFRGEIIVVDDGSRDQTEQAARKSTVNEKVLLKVTGYPDHRGKGSAVKKGILEAIGEVILFIDSGNCIPYEQVRTGIALIRNGECEIAHASRFLPGSRILHRQKKARRVASFLFRAMIRRRIGIPGHLTDSQCGLKIYRGNVAHELYSECFTRGFMFDVEIILRARARGYRIREFPVHWTYDPDTRLSIFRSLINILNELRRIRRFLG